MDTQIEELKIALENNERLKNELKRLICRDMRDKLGKIRLLSYRDKTVIRMCNDLFELIDHMEKSCKDNF
ncbi:MAG: hypothetical protein ACYTBW_00005 [Planctomycetota bacterium]